MRKKRVKGIPIAFIAHSGMWSSRCVGICGLRSKFVLTPLNSHAYTGFKVSQPFDAIYNFSVVSDGNFYSSLKSMPNKYMRTGTNRIDMSQNWSWNIVSSW